LARYKIILSYDGEKYSGFQRQNKELTIQETIENALRVVLRENISIVSSGRTDAGVSAIEQVCHIDTDQEVIPDKFKGYMNTVLPDDIRISDIIKTDENFHARYSAKKKIYEYYFYIGRNRVPVYDRFACFVGFDLNIENMQIACKYIEGIHDFTSFCASNTNVQDKTREIYSAEIQCIDNNLYKFVISGSGFLYNMVRIIMGTLEMIGMGRIIPEDILNIIDCKDRSKAGKTMGAKGLILKKVEYWLFYLTKICHYVNIKSVYIR